MNASPLTPYIPVCRAIAALLPNMVEVVLHDLATNTIAHIENAFTPRQVGDCSLLETENYAAELSGGTTIGPYKKFAPDGGKLKSVSALLTGSDGQHIGLLCINLRVDEFEKGAQLLSALALIQNDSTEFVKNDWREMANAIIAETLSERCLKLPQAKRADKLAIVAKLSAAEIFAARGSADYIAQALGISRANLYQLLREVR